MTDIRKWLDKGDKSSQRMPQLLPILIRQARLGTPITYGGAALELDVHYRAIPPIAGYIGYTLDAVAAELGWTHRPPPPLHTLIVNGDTRIPGSGIDDVLDDAYRSAATTEEKRAVLENVYAAAKSYPYWGELCELLDIPLDEGTLADAVEKARSSQGRGGEGPDHLALKNFVRDNPQIVGLVQGSKPGDVEYPTASGDRIDVVFERRRLRLAVEVKPHHSSEGDMLRGVFQCLKYRVILEAESALADEDVEVRVLLLLGGAATPEVARVANRLGIMVKDNVRAD